MFSLSKPSAAATASYLHQQRLSAYSYGNVGATRTERRPEGYRNIDHNRILLGHGAQTFERAKAALTTWKMFDIGWVQIAPSQSPIHEGVVVASVIRHLGFWSLNAARIVYAFDEPRRYGFAYGTLEDHSECGEERFMIEWNHDDDSVWYDLYAFSRPRHTLTRIGYPLARMLQRRFVHDSLQAMKRAIE